MNEIRLYSLPEKLIERFRMIRNLYDAVLYKDPTWHFLNEGDYILIRVSDKYCDELLSILDDNIFIYDYGISSYWDKDNSKIVTKYMNSFTIIFHEFSVLAMETPEEEFKQISDRIIHCYYNMSYLKYSDGKYNSSIWEAHQVSNYCMSRAIYGGKLINN